MRVAAFLLLATCACAAAASEVTVMRPSSIISQEWAYYIIVSERAVADLQSGERVTLQGPPDTRALVIQCPTTLCGYEESRLDYDFKSHPTAFFVLSPTSAFFALRALESNAPASFLR